MLPEHLHGWKRGWSGSAGALHIRHVTTSARFEPLNAMHEARRLKPLTLVFLGHKGALYDFASKLMPQDSGPSGVVCIPVMRDRRGLGRWAQESSERRWKDEATSPSGRAPYAVSRGPVHSEWTIAFLLCTATTLTTRRSLQLHHIVRPCSFHAECYLTTTRARWYYTPRVAALSRDGAERIFSESREQQTHLSAAIPVNWQCGFGSTSIFPHP